MTGLHMERVLIARRHVHAAARDGAIDLADGRRVVVPADTCCTNGDEIQRTELRERWKAMDRALDRGRRPRIAVADGRLVAVGVNTAVMHPAERHVLEALGLDVQAAIEGWRTMTLWSAPGAPCAAPPPIDFHTTVPGSRLTAAVEIAEGTAWEDGRLVLPAQFPETIMTAMIGRTLRDVVSIAGLDRVDLPILWAEQQSSAFGDGMKTTIQLVPDEGWTSILD